MGNKRRIPLNFPLISDQRGHLFPWLPVWLGVGIGVYFLLRFEPSLWAYGGLVAFVAVMLGGARLLRAPLSDYVRPVFYAFALVAVGVLLAGLRSHLLSAPVLGYRYYGPIEGRIIAIDRSASEAVRLTLDRVVLSNTSPERTPKHVRLSLHGEQGYITPELGLTVLLAGHLSPPSGPVEPGGFNFRRFAWFKQLGAVGYTRSPMLGLLPPNPNAAELFINRIRRRISTSVQAQIAGEEGGFAAAILTGDRSSISHATLQNLRNANLAHLLAISGLHMGMLTGFVFAAARLLFALWPWLSLRLPVKKIAAVIALIFGAGYLALSGGNVATIRAYIMVSVMFCAILLNRRALTLRAVAIAAVIVLTLQPESLTGPGFQMSFAATTALVAVFSALREMPNLGLPAPLRVLSAVVLSSFVAGLATAPFAAASFNQVAQYGLLANVVTVPLMGAIVMPAAVLAVLLAPFGLHALALEVMRWGVWWILKVAAWISGLEGALHLVITPDARAVPLIAFGGLVVILWRGKARLLGVPIMVLGAVFWAQTTRPTVLVSDDGVLFGVLTPAGRALNKERGAGFVAQSWLENDGDAAQQAEAFARAGLQVEQGRGTYISADLRLLQLSGKHAEARLAAGCAEYDIVVTTIKADPIADCLLFDLTKLRQTGSLAITQQTGGVEIISAREQEGHRLWSPR